MPKSNASTPDSVHLDLELPDLSGMVDPPNRVSPRMAYELTEQYALWFREQAAQGRSQRPPKCEVEFKFLP